MAKNDIINLLDKGNIARDLKAAYSFMLLSRGYTVDEIKILDDYVFMVRKKGFEEVTKVKVDDEVEAHRRRKQKSLPKSLVCLTSTSEVYNRRDHTIYSLNGNEPVTKGRLVWSIIKLHQQEKNSTYEEIRQLFNIKLNLLRKTVIDESSLELLSPDKQRRFYFHEYDLLESRDGIRYAVSSQWQIKKMNEIITFARSEGWKVEEIKNET
jgi:hypothetical protein